MLTPEQDTLRRSKGELMGELSHAGARFRPGSNACTCPFHDDATASAGVYCDEGVWRFKCHGCGIGDDIFGVRARLSGRTPGDELKAERHEDIKPEPAPRLYAALDELKGSLQNLTATYAYTNPETEAHDLVVFRLEANGAKRFLQARPERGGYVLKAPDGLLPVYNRARLRKVEECFVVEGEKCVHALHSAGFVATTSPGGALKAERADWTPLAEKTVYLWPDNDAPESAHPEGKGVAHMRQVQRILEKLGCRLYWIDPQTLGLGPKADVVDYLEANGGTRDEQHVAIELAKGEARPLGASREVADRFEEMIAGRWRNVEWPWAKLTTAAHALVPGTVTCVNGDAGSGKSFFVLESLWTWHLAGLRVALYALEDDRAFHLTRALAQLAQESRLTNPAWVEENAEEVRALYRNYADVLDSFGRSVWDAPDQEVTLKELETWVQARCEEGYDLIVIDPITAGKASEKRWLDDNTFMFGAKSAVKRSGSRLLLVTHPKEGEGKKNDTLGNMAGGAAYRRFSHSVLWLKKCEEPKTGPVIRDGIRVNVTYDRTLRIAKARNGPGAGLQIAYCMESDSLRFSEQGVVVTDRQRVAEQAEEERPPW